MIRTGARGRPTLENVFLFEKTDGVWLLTESYVWEE